MDKNLTIKKLERMAEEIERSGRDHTGSGPNDRYLQLMREYHDLVDDLLDRGLLTEPLAQPCLDDWLMSDKYWDFLGAYWDANPPELADLLKEFPVKQAARVKITRAQLPDCEAEVLENIVGRLPDKLTFKSSLIFGQSIEHWFKENDECLAFFSENEELSLWFGRNPIMSIDGRRFVLFFNSTEIPGIAGRPVQFEESRVTAYPLDELTVYIRKHLPSSSRIISH